MAEPTLYRAAAGHLADLARAERQRLPRLMAYLEALGLWVAQSEIDDRRGVQPRPLPELPPLNGCRAEAVLILEQLASRQRIEAEHRHELAAFLTALADRLLGEAAA